MQMSASAADHGPHQLRYCFDSDAEEISRMPQKQIY